MSKGHYKRVQHDTPSAVIHSNTYPEDEVEDKHQIFDAAQTSLRHGHTVKEKKEKKRGVRVQL